MMNEYLLFLDESGTSSLKNIDPYFPVLVLTGLLISKENYVVLEDKVNRLKRKYFSEKQVVFHRRDMRKYERGFEIFFNESIKRRFYSDLNNILSEVDFELISSAIDKKKYLATYGKLTNDPYQIALTFVLEQAIVAIDNKNTIIQSCIESRGKKEDKIVQAQYDKIIHRGSHDISATRFSSRFSSSLNLRKKSDMEIGIEIADLCAYPIARFVLNNNEPNPAFDVIRHKMASNNIGNVIGFGIKLFPN